VHYLYLCLCLYLYLCICMRICRLPKPLAFDTAEPLHMQFVMAAANLRAYMLGVTPPPDCRDPAALAAALAAGTGAVAVHSFTPALDASIETDSKEEDAKRKARCTHATRTHAAHVQTCYTHICHTHAAHALQTHTHATHTPHTRHRPPPPPPPSPRRSRFARWSPSWRRRAPRCPPASRSSPTSLKRCAPR